MGEYSKQSNKTRTKITDTFVTLCNQKGFYNVTLKELCETADIYRSTFYRYFDNIDDVLRSVGNEILEELEGYFNKSIKYNSVISRKTSHVNRAENREIFRSLLNIFFSNRQKLLLLFSLDADSFFLYNYKKFLKANLTGRLAEKNIKLDKYSDMLIEMLVGGEINSLLYILRAYEEPDEKMITYFADITVRVIYELPYELLSKLSK